MADPHANFGYSTVATAPSPASSGTSLVVQAGDGAKFPSSGAFNATVWPASTQPTTANAEIVRVTAISTDTFTITRAQESSSARTIVVGDQIADTITAKTLTDVELNVYVTTSDKTIPATTQAIFDDYLEVAASFFYELSTDAILVIGDFATPLPLPDINSNIFVSVADERVPSNSEIVFSDFYELSAPFTTEVGPNGIVQVGTGSPSSTYPPGYEFDYVQTTSSLTVTATTEGTAQTYIDGNTVFFDGSTRVKIEHFCPFVTISLANAIVPVLLDGATVIGWMGQEGGGQATAGNSLLLYGAIFVTPTSGLHTYHVQYFKTGGTGSANSGVGGSGTSVPAWYRITKA